MNYITTQHRYYTLDYYLKHKFNCKVFKVALNGDFSCPNRDGKISHNGCTFCSIEGSGDFAGNKNDSLQMQFNEIRNIISKKWPNAKYISYFQAFTNTYGSLTKLEKIYNEAINLDPNIVALSIATRPDCINEDIVKLIAKINQKTETWVELGLQTIYQTTANFINRGYNLDVFINAINLLHKYNIQIIVHIINGLPFETKEMMIETVKYLNNCNIQGIKIHSLYVLKGTTMEKQYLNKEFTLLSQNEYIDIVCEQLAYLNENIVVHRISGDAPKDLLIEPKWSLKKFVVMNEIDKKMKINNYTQGCKNKKS